MSSRMPVLGLLRWSNLFPLQGGYDPLGAQMMYVIGNASEAQSALHHPIDARRSAAFGVGE